MQRNATQRIPKLYLNNNFKFYILQFFREFNFKRLYSFCKNFVIAHVVRLSAMTIKNNLVKSFLTSIKFTFDSLSRKLKNPCLVINTKFILRSSYMNNKKIILIVLSVLTVAFVSCKDKGTDPTTFKVSSIVGTWSGEGVSFTIDNNGNVKMTMADGISVDKSFQIPEADWNSEKTEYTIKGDGVGLTGASITFKSAKSGTATSTAGTTDIKKQQ